MSSLLARVAAAAFCLALGACAEGSTIGPFSDGTGDGGAGDGGRSGDGGSGDGGRSGDGGSVSSPSASSGASTSGATTTGSSGATTSGVTTGVTTGVSSSATTTGVTTAASSSSSGGGDVECDPLDPAPECGAGQHCLPAPAGQEPVCVDAGSGGPYSACLGHENCSPLTACIEVDIFALPCCLHFCQGPEDCPGPQDSCYSFVDFGGPFYANGEEYGFCYDNLGGC